MRALIDMAICNRTLASVGIRNGHVYSGTVVGARQALIFTNWQFFRFPEFTQDGAGNTKSIQQAPGDEGERQDFCEPIGRL